MARLLSSERLFVGVELLLFPHVDPIFRPSRKHVVQFPVVLHGRDPALGQPVDRLLLLRGRKRYDLEARLREQGFLLGDNRLASAGGLTCCH